MTQVVHIITGLKQGGAEALLYRMLVAAGNRERFAVISLQDEAYYGERIRELGVPLHTLRMKPGSVSPADLLRLVRLLKRLRPNAVQTWLYHADLLGGMAARLAGIRRIFWGLHNSDLDTMRSSWTKRLVLWSCRKFSGMIPEAIVSCSRRAADIHRRAGYCDRFVVIPNGYDVDTFKPDSCVRRETRSAWRIEQNGFVFGCVGRFTPKKDQLNFVRAAGLAAREASQARFVMCGRDIDDGNADLMWSVRETGVEERFVLLGPQDDMRVLMNGLDVLVLSSAYGEAFPNVVAEAMACGTPCIVTDVGDAPVIVSDTGWVVPPGESESLARAMLSALTEDGEPRKHRKSLARQRIIDNYDIKTILDRYEQLWAE